MDKLKELLDDENFELIISRKISEKTDSTKQKLFPNINSLQKDLEKVGFRENYFMTISLKGSSYEVNVYAERLL